MLGRSHQITATLRNRCHLHLHLHDSLTINIQVSTHMFIPSASLCVLVYPTDYLSIRFPTLISLIWTDIRLGHTAVVMVQPTKSKPTNSTHPDPATESVPLTTLSWFGAPSSSHSFNTSKQHKRLLYRLYADATTTALSLADRFYFEPSVFKPQFTLCFGPCWTGPCLWSLVTRSRNRRVYML